MCIAPMCDFLTMGFYTRCIQEYWVDVDLVLCLNPEE